MIGSEPRSRYVLANRLRHHLLEWGSSGPTVLLLHGFLEHAHAWDRAAPRLASAGFHVYGLDWRGHGDSEWIGPGGYYHYADYVADLAFLVPQLAARVALIAHSMGGGAAVTYAGTQPERVWALVSVEGLGLPNSDPSSAPERYATWLQDLERVASRKPRSVTLAEATERLRERQPRFSVEIARHMAEWGTRGEGERRVWKFDPLHQTQTPQPYYVAQARAFWQRVTCPVLYVEGAETFLRLSGVDLAERLQTLRARHVTIAGAGHHPHLEQPEAFAEFVLTFLRGASAADEESSLRRM
jgi:pimeloyl-ACP methyl ester carboxylesterase